MVDPLNPLDDTLEAAIDRYVTRRRRFSLWTGVSLGAVFGASGMYFLSENIGPNSMRFLFIGLVIVSCLAQLSLGLWSRIAEGELQLRAQEEGKTLTFTNK